MNLRGYMASALLWLAVAWPTFRCGARPMREGSVVTD